MIKEHKIVCVAPSAFGDAWRTVGALLLRGLHAAEMPVVAVMDDIRSGARQFWLVTTSNPPDTRACFVTEIAEDATDGKRVVWVSALAGKGITEWGRVLSDRMVEFARAEKCTAVRFAGRESLARVYGDCRVISRDGDASILERAA